MLWSSEVNWGKDTHTHANAHMAEQSASAILWKLSKKFGPVFKKVRLFSQWSYSLFLQLLLNKEEATFHNIEFKNNIKTVDVTNNNHSMI